MSKRTQERTLKSYHYLIGIDPGTTTGMAIWDVSKQSFIQITSGSFIEIYHEIQSVPVVSFALRIEDARQRTWFGNAGRAQLQGAGSIKRDCSIWEEVCRYHHWDYEMVHPLKGATKWDHTTFCNVTGWPGGRTNSHQRDAGMLVWGL